MLLVHINKLDAASFFKSVKSLDESITSSHYDDFYTHYEYNY